MRVTSWGCSGIAQVHVPARRMHLCFWCLAHWASRWRHKGTRLFLALKCLHWSVERNSYSTAWEVAVRSYRLSPSGAGQAAEQPGEELGSASGQVIPGQMENFLI